MTDVVVLDAARTAVGESFGGSFTSTRSDDLGGHVIAEVLVRNPYLDPAQVADLYWGCSLPDHSQGYNVARQVGLLSGMPDRVPAVTISRSCGSAFSAIRMAAHAIAAGDGDVYLAGGGDSFTMCLGKGFSVADHNPRFVDESRPDFVNHAYMEVFDTAEIVAEAYGVSRPEMDEFAVLSHERAVRATKEGYFAEEIVPYLRPDGVVVDADDSPRADTSVDQLAALRPISPERGGRVTAGNTCVTHARVTESRQGRTSPSLLGCHGSRTSFRRWVERTAKPPRCTELRLPPDVDSLDGGPSTAAAPKTTAADGLVRCRREQRPGIGGQHVFAGVAREELLAGRVPGKQPSVCQSGVVQAACGVPSSQQRHMPGDVAGPQGAHASPAERNLVQAGELEAVVGKNGLTLGPHGGEVVKAGIDAHVREFQHRERALDRLSSHVIGRRTAGRANQRQRRRFETDAVDRGQEQGLRHAFVEVHHSTPTAGPSAVALVEGKGAELGMSSDPSGVPGADHLDRVVVPVRTRLHGGSSGIRALGLVLPEGPRDPLQELQRGLRDHRAEVGDVHDEHGPGHRGSSRERSTVAQLTAGHVMRVCPVRPRDQRRESHINLALDQENAAGPPVLVFVDESPRQPRPVLTCGLAGARRPDFERRHSSGADRSLEEAKVVRRVVTGEGPDGSSRFLGDEVVDEGVVWFGRFGAYSDLVNPVEASGDFDLNGPDAGYSFRVFSLPPDWVTKPMYASGNVPLHDKDGFHRTQTVDLVIVLEGEVISEMDDGETVRLKPGDCLIQRGTRHAWRNPGQFPVKLAAVLLNDRRPSNGEDGQG